MAFVAVDILGPLPRTRSGNEFVVINTERYSKRTRVIPTTKNTSTQVANISFSQCVIAYGIPDTIFSDNAQQYLSPFFIPLCSDLVVEKLTGTAYHSYTSGKVERYSRTPVTRLRLSDADHLRYWANVFTHLHMRTFSEHIDRGTLPLVCRRASSILSR